MIKPFSEHTKKLFSKLPKKSITDKEAVEIESNFLRLLDSLKPQKRKKPLDI